MISQNSGGDSLARGLTRYTFRPAGQKKTQKEWDDMFADVTDAETFIKKAKKKKKVTGEKETNTIIR